LHDYPARSANTATINDTRLTATLENQDFIQPSRPWLTTKAERYLDIMEQSTDPNIVRAGELLSELTAATPRTYEAIIIGRAKEVDWGHLTTLSIPALREGTSLVTFINLIGRGSGNL
jgi:hypothetical protein